MTQVRSRLGEKSWRYQGVRRGMKRDARGQEGHNGGESSGEQMTGPRGSQTYLVRAVVSER